MTARHPSQVSLDSMNEQEVDTKHYAETMFSKVSAQGDALRKIEENQRLLQSQQNSSLGDGFAAMDKRVGMVEESLSQQQQQLRQVVQKQDDIFRLLMIQEKVAQQDHQINEFIQYQQQCLTSGNPGDANKHAEVLRHLRDNQTSLMQLLAQLHGSLHVPHQVVQHDIDGNVISNPHGYAVPNLTGEEQHNPEFRQVKKFFGEPTIIGKPDADRFVDAKTLRRALKGLGCDERALIGVLSRRSWQQRKSIAEAYQSSYSRELVKDIKRKTGMNLERTLVALCMTPVQYDAYMCREALEGLGTNDTLLIEVLCTRRNWQVLELKDTYQEMYQRSLENDVKADTGGYYQQLLAAILQGTRRDEPDVVDMTEIQDAVRKLYAAGEAKVGTDEKVFIEILTTYSFAEIREIADHYRKVSDFELERAISRETSFNFKQALVTIVRAASDPHEFYAELAYKAVRGVGTNERLLSRVLVSRCEIDLKTVAEKYREMFDEDMIGRVRRETGGNYRRLLMALFGDEAFDPNKDAKVLRGALNRIFGAQKDTVNHVFAQRTLNQRILIAKAYESNYQKDLKQVLKDKLFTHHEMICISMLTPRAEFIAQEVRRCIEGLGTLDAHLIEIICSMEGDEMREVKDAYQQLFSRTMADDIASDTSGDYKKLLLALVNNERGVTQPMISDDMMKQEAGRLLKAGEDDRFGTDEDVFIEIFSKYNHANLRKIFDQYSRISDRDITKVVKDETSFNFEAALVSIIQAVRDPTSYFAARLNSFMKRIGTSDQSLIRVMVLRYEIDLADISEAYYQKFHRSLESHIISETSGFYKRMLLLMLSHASTMSTQTLARRNAAELAQSPNADYLHTGRYGSTIPMSGPIMAGMPNPNSHLVYPPPPMMQQGYGMMAQQGQYQQYPQQQQQYPSQQYPQQQPMMMQSSMQGSHVMYRQPSYAQQQRPSFSPSTPQVPNMSMQSRFDTPRQRTDSYASTPNTQGYVTVLPQSPVQQPRVANMGYTEDNLIHQNREQSQAIQSAEEEVRM